MQEMQEILGSILGVTEITWGRKWGPIPVFLPRKFHGQRSLVGYSPWGCEKSDMTERLSIHTQIENHMQKYSQEGFLFIYILLSTSTGLSDHRALSSKKSPA